MLGERDRKGDKPVVTADDETLAAELLGELDEVVGLRFVGVRRERVGSVLSRSAWGIQSD